MLMGLQYFLRQLKLHIVGNCVLSYLVRLHIVLLFVTVVQIRPFSDVSVTYIIVVVVVIIIVVLVVLVLIGV